MMKINFVHQNRKQNWNKFLIANDGNFLQSFEWGNFQERLALKIWRVEISEDNKIFLEALVVEKRTFGFTNFYIPYGPIFARNLSFKEKQVALSFFLKNIRQLAKQERAWFLNIEPIVPLPKVNHYCFVPSFKRNQPLKTSLLGIARSKKELLSSFRTRTRYNINLARRKGVTIKILDYYAPIFYYLLKKTSHRQSFASFSEKHYEEMFQAGSQDFRVKMFLAEYQEKIIVASIVIFFGNKAVSLHTGSDYQYRAVKGSELLHWRVILYAQEIGCTLYDFWGIDEKRFLGVSNFKRGFQGKEIQYPFGVDIVFNNIGYQVYKAIRAVKQLF